MGSWVDRVDRTDAQGVDRLVRTVVGDGDGTGNPRDERQDLLARHAVEDGDRVVRPIDEEELVRRVVEGHSQQVRRSDTDSDHLNYVQGGQAEDLEPGYVV